jgi:hypothetical protein
VFPSAPEIDNDSDDDYETEEEEELEGIDSTIPNKSAPAKMQTKAKKNGKDAKEEVKNVPKA